MQAREVNSKITSIKKTAKITKAMELVSAAKMKKTQLAMNKARPYNKSIRTIISHIAKGNLAKIHPFLVQRDIKTATIVVVSTNKGLCGSLNTRLFYDVLHTIKALHKKHIAVELILMGNKAINYFSKLPFTIQHKIPNLTEKPTMQDFLALAALLADRYRKQATDSIYFAYNIFVNSLAQKPCVDQILPLPKLIDDLVNDNAQWDYDYESDEVLLLHNLFLRYLEDMLYQANLENIAAEQAARMIAMKNATDNANNLVDELNLIYNKLRQANITNEINEIIAGAESI